MRLNRLTLTDLLNSSVERYADYPFVSFPETDPYTYARFSRKVSQVQEFLRARGVEKGDKVALVSENRPHWGICYFAVATMGAVVVPVLTDFHPEEITSIIEHSEVVGIFTSTKLLKKISDMVGTERWIVEIEDFVEIGADGSEGERVVAPLDSAGGAETAGGADSADARFQRADAAPRIEEMVEEEDTAVIIYTSGTTGSPKGVVLSHRNLAHNALSTTDIPRKLRPGDRLLSLLPLAHTYECTIGFLTPLLIGCRIFYLGKPPSPTVLLPALEKVQPQVVISVPLLIEKIYRNLIAPKFQKNRILQLLIKISFTRKILHRFAGGKLKKTFGGKLKYFIIGGAALAEDVEKFLREAKFPLAMGYGLTETSPLIAGSTEEYAKLYTIGPAIAGVTMRIDSPDPENEPGEVLVKGPNVMQGYYKDEEKTSEVLNSDGWFHTGDLGVIDRDGYLSLRGRLKNVILGPSGENIYPESIESVLNEYKFVNESVVFEQEGRLIAKVHLDYDAIMEHMRDFAESAIDKSRDVSKDVSRIGSEYLSSLRKMVNKRLNAFSKLHSIFEQKEPFEKTPTKKIKRYKYTRKKEEKSVNGNSKRETPQETGHEKD